MRLKLERIALTLWVGGLWAIGYLAVPILFASLDDRMQAGMLAGKMFTALSYLGLGCGVVLLALNALKLYLGRPIYLRMALLGVMVVLVAIGEFGLQPQMAALKLQGLVEGSEAAVQFARLHGVASTLYLLVSACGLGLVAIGPARAAQVD